MSIRDLAILSEPVRLVAYVDFFAPDDTWDLELFEGHIYEGERCLFCNVNVYDNMIYGPWQCVPHKPLTHTTETGDPSVFDTEEF